MLKKITQRYSSIEISKKQALIWLVLIVLAMVLFGFFWLNKNTTQIVQTSTDFNQIFKNPKLGYKDRNYKTRPSLQNSLLRSYGLDFVNGLDTPRGVNIFVNNPGKIFVSYNLMIESSLAQVLLILDNTKPELNLKLQDQKQTFKIQDQDFVMELSSAGNDVVLSVINTKSLEPFVKLQQNNYLSISIRGKVDLLTDQKLQKLSQMLSLIDSFDNQTYLKTDKLTSYTNPFTINPEAIFTSKDNNDVTTIITPNYTKLSQEQKDDLSIYQDFGLNNEMWPVFAPCNMDNNKVFENSDLQYDNFNYYTSRFNCADQKNKTYQYQELIYPQNKTSFKKGELIGFAYKRLKLLDLLHN
jgi:hypothetical protein